MPQTLIKDLEAQENWRSVEEGADSWFLAKFCKKGELVPLSNIVTQDFFFEKCESKNFTLSIVLLVTGLIFSGIAWLLFSPAVLEKAKSAGEALAMQSFGGFLGLVAFAFFALCFYFAKDALKASKNKKPHIFYEGSKMYIFNPVLDSFAKSKNNDQFSVIEKDSIQTIKYLPSLRAYGGIAPAAKAALIEIKTNENVYNIGRYYISSTKEELNLANFLSYFSGLPVEFYFGIDS